MAIILHKATYASETWTLKKEVLKRLEVFEMQYLISIYGVTLYEPNTHKHSETKRLRRFGHVTRIPEEIFYSVFPNPRLTKR